MKLQRLYSDLNHILYIIDTTNVSSEETRKTKQYIEERFSEIGKCENSNVNFLIKNLEKIINSYDFNQLSYLEINVKVLNKIKNQIKKILELCKVEIEKSQIELFSEVA